MSETAGDRPATRVECLASNDLFVRRLLVVVLVFGGAIWAIVDHYVMGNYWNRGDFNGNLSFLFNHYLPYVLTPLGLAMLVRALQEHSRRLVADEKGIGFAGKEQIAWGRLARIDATLLASKSQLILYYIPDGQTGQGGQDKVETPLKLDAYSFRNFRDMVALIERQVPADRIQR